jgi:threonine synthase
MAAHAASADLECLVFVPANIPPEQLELIVRHDPIILRIEGGYDRLYRESSPTHTRPTADRRQLRQSVARRRPEDDRAGTRTGVRAGDARRGGPTRLQRRPRERHLEGLSGGSCGGSRRRPPELYFVQTAVCAPIAAAWERGDETVRPVEGGETVAYSIANASPPSGNRVLAAARETDGGVLAVDDDAILDARRALAERAGLFVESSSATALAGARRLTERGVLGPTDEVALVATGAGFTERAVDART